MQVYGRGMQGADYGYTKVRGYHPQLATLPETGQVIFSRMRGGKAGAARKTKSFLTETVSRLRHTGATGQLTMRADSAFYSRAVISTARTHRVRFSITVRQDKKVRAAIESIGEDAWRPIPYWLSTPEVSGADVAETSYTCFTHTTDAIEVRLIVRRVRPTPVPSWRCSPTGTTTPSSPTATVRRSNWRPITAAPWSSSPSPSSNPPVGPTPPRAGSSPTRLDQPGGHGP
jgi:hypothetical protein